MDACTCSPGPFTQAFEAVVTACLVMIRLAARRRW
jgi:hypothetical protein